MTTGDSLTWICLTTFFFFSSAVYLQISPLLAKDVSQDERLARSGKSPLVLPSRAAVAQLSEREHRVLKLRKNYKQNKWNPLDMVLTDPLLDCNPRRLLLCTA